MDTLTHALSGGLLARLTGRPGDRLSLNERTLAGFLAAAFPDLDFALFWVDRLNYLNWHRGPTHSLLLLPLWAFLLAIILARFWPGRPPWQAFFGVCALGIAAHIGGDVITLYGIKLLWPLSDGALGLGIVFDVDPYIALIVALGFIGALRWRPRLSAALMLMALTVYLGLQTAVYWRTIALAEAYRDSRGLKNAEVYVLPQPLSPFTWKLIVAQGNGYFVSHVNYLATHAVSGLEELGFPGSLLVAYRPASELVWKEYTRYGEGLEVQAIAKQVWRQQQFAAFRRFAVLPALYRVDREEGGARCAWFTDLRYSFPGLPPTFRYGLCGVGPEENWRLYRLPYFRADDRQLL